MHRFAPRRAAGRRPTVLPVIAAVVAACGGIATPAASPVAPTVAPVPTPTPVVSAALTPSPSPAAVDVEGLLDARRREYGAPGALALRVRGGNLTWATSGTADVDGTPITESTRFRIASITKPIVAALVLDAVDRGEVSLDAVVGDLVPGLLRPDRPAVTVRQLLDHTSGIADASNDFSSLDEIAAAVERIADPDLRAEARRLLTQAVAGERVMASDRMIVALSETLDRSFAPGAGYHYSNTNYQLAAMVLEAATGTPIDRLLAERVAEPLGLTLTSVAPPDLGSPEMRGYGTSTEDGSLVDLTDDLSFFGNGGNGGIISTADELLTVMQAIVGEELLPADLTADMKRPNRSSYGLGLATYGLSCGTFYGHEGGVNGQASIAIVSPDGADGVVIAMNLRSGDDPRLPALADAMLCGGR